MKIILAILLLLEFTLPNLAFADDASDLDACVSIVNERIAARGAKDWPNLLKTSRKYLATCKKIVSAERYSDAYGDMISAYIRMDNPKFALGAADDCISIYYVNTFCHAGRASSLLQLNRKSEARIEIERTEKLLSFRRTQLNEQLANSREPSYRRAIEASIQLDNSLQNSLDSLKLEVNAD